MEKELKDLTTDDITLNGMKQCYVPPQFVPLFALVQSLINDMPAGLVGVLMVFDNPSDAKKFGHSDQVITINVQSEFVKRLKSSDIIEVPKEGKI